MNTRRRFNTVELYNRARITLNWLIKPQRCQANLGNRSTHWPEFDGYDTLLVSEGMTVMISIISKACSLAISKALTQI